MRKFHVNVNGTPYEVEVEEIAAGAATAAPILDIKGKVGDMVEANTVVIMLEAMKMENEIFAGAAGKVTAINVTKGSTVNSGDVLVVIG